jgi:hypothetical protein
MKIFAIFLVISLWFSLPLGVQAQANSNYRQEIHALTECNDGIDNDGNGTLDFGSDPNCSSWDDDTESPDVPPAPTPELPAPVQQPPVFTEVPEEEVAEAATFIEEVASGVERLLFDWTPLGVVLGVSSLADIENLDLVYKTSLGVMTSALGCTFIFLWVLLLLLLKKIIKRIKKWWKQR